MATKSIAPMVKRWDDEHTYVVEGSYFYHTLAQAKNGMQKDAAKWLLNTSWKELDSGAYWYGRIERQTKTMYGDLAGTLRAYRYRDNGIDIIDCVFNGKSIAVPTKKVKEILKK